MIIYHIITTYHLISAMTMQAQSKQPAILLIPISITQKYPNYKSLEGELFDKIIQYNSLFRYQNGKEATKQYFEKLLSDVKSITDIYVWGAQYSYGIYLAEQKIPFSFCEEATGMMSRRRILEHIDELNPHLANLYDYVYKLGLYTGNSPQIKNLICNNKVQLDGFDVSSSTHWSIVEGMSEIDKDQRDKIISFFTKIRSINIPENSTILFTQPLANLRLTSYEEEILIYQLFVDYFFHNAPLVVKPHPDDLIPYSRIFPDATIVRERFPSEFLPFLVDNQPKKISTIYSTAVYNLRGYYKDVFELDMQYEKLYSRTHRYAMAIEMAKKLDKKIYLYGCYEVLMEKLAELISCDVHILHDLEQFPQDGVVLIDDIGSREYETRKKLQNILNSLLKNNIVIFLNSLNDYCWYSVNNKEIWEHIKPIVLKKQRIVGMEDYEYFYESLEDETMYAYSYDEEILNSIGSMKMNKQLNHVGIEVTKEDLSKQEERIKILEGILDATEQSLLYYINRVKELENK